MRSQGKKKQRRLENLSNQPTSWHPLPHQDHLNNWGKGSGPWCYPPPPPQPQYSEFDQFAAAYHSDRFVGENSFQSPYQRPFYNGYENNIHQHTYGQTSRINFQQIEFQKNVEQNGANFMNVNVKSEPFVSPNVQSSRSEAVDAETVCREKLQKDQTPEDIHDKDSSHKRGLPLINQKRNEKKTVSHVSPESPQKNKSPPKLGKKNSCEKSLKKTSLSESHQTSGKERFKWVNNYKKATQEDGSPAVSSAHQNGASISGRFPLLAKRSSNNGPGLLGKAPLPYAKAGQNGKNNLGCSRSLMPSGRGGQTGRPPLPHGRGAHNSSTRSSGNQWNGTFGSRVHDYDEDDECNEINHWLVNSKDKESIHGKDESSVNKDPLPGSEEARTNAIKEAADRLKQALKQKKNVNLNKLLSSGVESKNDNHAQSKLNTCPKNLAMLELDASDMRAIGRANTENSNCLAEDNSDDDIIEVQRSPSPVPQVIDLEMSQTDDPPELNNSCSASCVSNDNYEDFPSSERVERIPKLSVQNDKHVPQCPSPGNSQNSFQDVPLSGRLKSPQATTKESEGTDKVNGETGQNTFEFTTCMEAESIKTNSCSENDILQRNDPKIMSQNTDSGHNIVNVESSLHAVVLNNNSGTLNGASPNKNGASPRNTVGPPVACVRRASPTEERISKNHPLSPAPNLNQRRRRASSSSLCESASPRSANTGPSNSHEQPAKPGNFQPKSPLSTFRSIHDSKQRKIISDLKKINQSKLKDLVNNPRSGKLDFAMKQLMKEHRSVLSRMSRDVAEKRIPAEFLNPKSTELPPDDSTLLADFAIDWSSLPGELISTLGDLFQDFSTDTALSIGESQCHTSSEPHEIPDIELMFPGCTTDESSALAVEEKGDGQTLASAERSSETSDTVKIRVCQFAREKLCSPSENDEANTWADNFEHSSPKPLPVPVTAESDVLVEERQVQTSKNDFSGPDESRNKSCTQVLNQTEDANLICFGLISPEDVDRPKSKDSNLNVTEPLPTESICSQDNVSVEKSSNNSPGAQKSSVKNRLARVRGVKKKKNKNKNKRAKVKKFVHLEERSWFVESMSPNKAKPLPRSKTTKFASHNTPPNSNIVTNPLSNISCQITEAAPSETILAEDSIPDNGDRNNGNQRKHPDDIQSYMAVSSNNPGVQNQCVSMLPVLMMTVPANETSNAACNLSVPEMQMRISEIDLMLQDLVQERFILSQSLKAAEATVEGSSQNVIKNPPMQSSSQFSEHNDGGLIEVNVNETQSLKVAVSAEESLPDTVRRNSSMQSSSQFLELDSSTLIEGNEAGTLTDNHSAIENEREILKRKCPPNNSPDGNHPTLKKICHGNLSSLQNSANSTSNVSSITNNVLSSCQDESSEKVPHDVISKNGVGNAAEGSLKNDDEVCVISQNTVSLPRKVLGDYIRREYLEGNILALKVLDLQIFAASSNGLVYMFLAYPWRDKCHSLFGKPSGNSTSSGVTCIEVVKNYLYTGSEDGALNIYSIPSKPEGDEIVRPTSTYNISNGIQCMEANWNFVYIGTKVGCVIPFNLTTKQVEEPLITGQDPVLCIKCCREGPRRVLIVASRKQPIAIRDARSGLLLRSLGGCEESTVYSVLCHKNLVYCGSNTNKILVFDFQSGEPKYKLETAGQGIIDLKVYEDHLFCGCYDGKIYVFNLKKFNLVCCLDGPGKMILALDFLKHCLLCSSKDHPLTIYKRPLGQYFEWYLRGEKT